MRGTPPSHLTPASGYFHIGFSRSTKTTKNISTKKERRNRGIRRIRSSCLRDFVKKCRASCQESRASNQERAPGQLAMIQPCGSIEFFDDRRERLARAPFVRAPTGGLKGLLPHGPPRRHEPSERLDDEDAAATFGVREQARQQPITRRLVELVDRECGDHRALRGKHGR